MAVFCIDTASGQVATLRQLVESGIASELDSGPPRPWLRIQGTNDATTMWYAVMRKRTRGVFIGALCIRHSDHHASLSASGWEEVPIAEIAPPGSEGVPAGRPDQAM